MTINTLASCKGRKTAQVSHEAASRICKFFFNVLNYKTTNIKNGRCKLSISTFLFCILTHRTKKEKQAQWQNSIISNVQA